MKKFNEYFLMKNDDVIDYVKVKTSLFDDDSELSCDEIGDGNLNYVFKVKDNKGGKSAVIKQAGHVTRISEDMTLSVDRIKREANVLKIHNGFVPTLVPEVYLYDDVMKCFVMEDLSDHEILRGALISHKTFPNFAEDISAYIVNTTLLTTDVVMNPKDKKVLQQEYINPELCEISEDLVYTEPFNDYNNRNILFELNADWIKKEIYQDKTLKLEAAKLKNDFLTKGQALIHGDLHTGSVFVTRNSTKVIDPEFTFYGPIGYDLGNVIAHLIFAYKNGEVSGKTNFCDWILNTIKDVIDLFIEKFETLWDKNVTDSMAQEPGYKEWYLSSVLEDSTGVAGLELVRRIVGMAQVDDITSIGDTEKRIDAERFCLKIGKELIINRKKYKQSEDFSKLIKSFL